ncbi:precorrin-3B synthase [Pseudomonas gingeri]|uniref:Precorrin-3B synthase n=1 Tax=Pseudomonas gingeri TaxID=117681 RepID=A0A7Y7XHS2_9PSED|nr:precorrin-3B synthase [Pseudomonas gingeri]
MLFDNSLYLSFTTGRPLNPRSPATAIRPSACPGLLRIVPALDGGICRIKLAGGVIDSTQAQAVARAAARYAGGVIEATNRANLQIRGIGAQHTALIDELLEAGLGPTTPAGDDVRNLMLSPSAGIDRHLLIDTRPLAEQILATLQTHERFHELSAKFALQLDGGEALAMLEHPHDLWLSALLLDDQMYLAFGLAGCPANDLPLAAVPLAEGHGLVVAVLEQFLDLARPEQTRMRHLLADISPAEFLAQLTRRLGFEPVVVPSWHRSAAPGLLHIGTYPQRQPGLVAIGAVAPLGRLDATMLDGAGRLANDFGDASLRLTPWQSLLLPNIRVEDAATVTVHLQHLGLSCDAADALAQLIACTGSAGCGKGLADTKADARSLALQLQDQPQGVHLSGCTRSCAAAHVAPATLLAVAPGHYDLYLRDAMHPGFGRLQARNLTIEAAGVLLAARPRSNTDD